VSYPSTFVPTPAEQMCSDAGDHHDGSGLVSSSPYSAARADEIFGMVDYDVLTIGNHELYKYESAKWLYDNAKRWYVPVMS
jgi:2',3'-cyclic-nucleotide 2'-phosphodiesterase (5'-nucleotidase family)